MSAEQVSAALAAHGRHVGTDVIEAELASLEGLSADEAATTLLACYGLSCEGTPTARFTRDFSGSRIIRDVLHEGRPAVVFTLIASLFAIVPALAVPFGMRFFLDRYVVAGKTEVGPFVAIGLIAAAAVATALVTLQYVVLRRSYLRLSAIGQTGFAWHVLHMRSDDLEAIAPGEIIAKMNARQRLAYQGGLMLPAAAANALSASAFILALAALDLTMCAATLVVGALTAGLSLAILRSRSAVQVHNDAAMSALTGTADQTLSAMESVKAAAWEQFAFKRWSLLRTRMATTQSNLAVATQWLVFIPAVGLALGLGAVLAIGTLQVINGALSLGTLVASQAFVAMFLEALGMLVYLGVLLQAISSAGRQSGEVLQSPLDPEALEPVNPAAVGTLTGEVALRAVTFGYSRHLPPLICDLNLDLKAGERVALVGASGSGKTTIARLVTGELRPWSGHVEFDGVPRLRIPRQVKAQSVAYVPQHPTLFAGTIRDNLTLWNDDVSDEQVRRAAQDACIESTILSRDGGYFATVRGDGGFSGGERQRLAIARALVNDPRVLILDEATSALDPVVEAEVERNLRRRGCTCLVVAHRLSTVRDADQILVVRDGGVVQRGRFDEIKHVGAFAELVNG